jgi:soluble lytic murein transglycosylase-like protein
MAKKTIKKKPVTNKSVTTASAPIVYPAAAPLSEKIENYIIPSATTDNLLNYSIANNRFQVPVQIPYAKQLPYGQELSDDVLLRQVYAESAFNPKAVSKAGYKGLGQIGEDVIESYKKATGVKNVDPFNINDNLAVQKWAMTNLYNADFINRPDQDPEIRLAKTLAAYNWGRGNLSDYLSEQKKKGVDIYNSKDWINNLPKETKDYIEKILYKSNDQFNEEFKKAIGNDKYKNITQRFIYDPNKVVIDDNMGQWAHPGEVTRIASNDITMKGVPYPVLGVGADGEQRMMYPNEEHTFNEAPVTEYPMMQAKHGGWLNKYQSGTTNAQPTLSFATRPVGAINVGITADNTSTTVNTPRGQVSTGYKTNANVSPQMSKQVAEAQAQARGDRSFKKPIRAGYAVDNTGTRLSNPGANVSAVTSTASINAPEIGYVAPHKVSVGDIVGGAITSIPLAAGAVAAAPLVESAMAAPLFSGAPAWATFGTALDAAAVPGAAKAFTEGNYLEGALSALPVGIGLAKQAGSAIKDGYNLFNTEKRVAEIGNEANAATHAAEEATTATSGQKPYVFKKQPILAGAEGQVHRDAVDIVNREYNTALKEAAERNIPVGAYNHPDRPSMLVADQVGHDYVMPEGMTHDQLNQVALRFSGQKFSPQEANTIVESLVAHNPELRGIIDKVNANSILNGVASNVHPNDIVVGHNYFENGIEPPMHDLYDHIGSLQEHLPENRGLSDFVYSPESLEKIKNLTTKDVAKYKKDGGLIYANGGKISKEELEYLQSVAAEDFASNPRNAEIERQKQELQLRTKQQEQSIDKEQAKRMLLQKLKEYSGNNTEEDDDYFYPSETTTPKQVVKDNYIYVNPGDKVTRTSIQGEMPRKPVNAVDDGIFLAFADAIQEYKERYPDKPLPRISSGLRTRAQQEELYANRGSNRYPVAKPGTSKHELGQALDIVFDNGGSDEDYQRLANLMSPRGFKWLGDYDKVHFEVDPNYPKTYVSDEGNVLMTGQMPSTKLDVTRPKPRAFQDGGWLTQYQDGSIVMPPDVMTDPRKLAQWMKDYPEFHANVNTPTSVNSERNMPYATSDNTNVVINTPKGPINTGTRNAPNIQVPGGGVSKNTVKDIEIVLDLAEFYPPTAVAAYIGGIPFTIMDLYDDYKKGSQPAEYVLDALGLIPGEKLGSKAASELLNLANFGVDVKDYPEHKYGGKTWLGEYAQGGEVFSAGGEKHKVYKKESPTGNGKGVKGHIMVTHPTKDKGKWDTIDLTKIAGAKTVAQGVAATKKWHKENPEYKLGGWLKSYK